MPFAVAPCPVEAAIQVIGGKWKLLILRSLKRAAEGVWRHTRVCPHADAWRFR